MRPCSFIMRWRAAMASWYQFLGLRFSSIVALNEQIALAGIAGPDRVRRMVAHRPEAETMHGGRAVSFERLPMLVRRITFVILQPVLWEDEIPFPQTGVARNLRQ